MGVSRAFVAVALLLGTCGLSWASPFMQLVNLTKLEESVVEYSSGVNNFEGHFAYDTTIQGKRPVVVIIPNEMGLDDFDVWLTRRLAHAGYAGYAIDLYGTDVPREGINSIPEERRSSLMSFLQNNPEEWMERCRAGIASVANLDGEIADTDKIVVIGYSFGGLSALEMVRKGAKVDGVVSIHPTSFKSGAAIVGDPFEGRLAVFLGGEQTGFSGQDIFDLQAEFKEAGVTFEVTRFGKADDDFWVPTQDKLELESIERQIASTRTWDSLLGFLDDVFNPENVDYLDEPFQTTLIDETKLQTGTVQYKEGDTNLEGFYAYDKTMEGPRPVVIIVPDWDGVGEYELWRAKRVANLGYVGFVADMYGTDVAQGPTLPFQERIKQTTTLNGNGGTGALARQLAAMDAARSSEELSGVIDPDSFAAIGYCFGGTAVLGLLRDQPDGLKGIVAYHAGGLEPAGEKVETCNNIPALVQNGDDDPSVTEEDIVGFVAEFNEARANWEFVDYGDTLHSFTNPQSPRKVEEGARAAYSPFADTRSWHSTKTFFEKIFSKETMLYQACPSE
ncbi:hypothetical protein BSKO_03990 [Bryopsis sp. KO-2023]|nr:hypothetical protein BSKO_03990 [Bryopsis sp. KO-2023]